MRVSDYIINFLEKNNIDTVFTVSGGGSIFLCDALYNSRKIQYICHHHEQAAAFAAESYARAKKGVGCCLVTTGPGGTNTVTGVSCCWTDSVPVIFISGQVFLDQTIKKSKRRQIGVQESDIVSIVKSITKYSKIVKSPTEIKKTLQQAFFECQNKRPGPVWIDIPADIQSANLRNIKMTEYKNPKEKLNIKNLTKKIKNISKIIKKSERPLIHLGHGIRLSGAEQLIKKFLSKNSIPFISTWNADDLMPHNHNYNFGKAGAFGERGSNFIVQNCDFYMSIGTRLPYMVTGYDTKQFAKNAKTKIMIDIDQNELNRNDIHFDYKINIDAKKFLEIFLKNLTNFKSPKNWIDYCNRLKEKYPVVQKSTILSKKYVNSYFFIKKLSDILRSNDTIVTDMGFSFTTSHQAMEIKKDQKFFTNSGHAPMGWGLPAAIGAYYGLKGKSRIVCLTGEGGFQMNIQELSTIMHNNIPIKIFIFNNGGYLTIKQTQILGFNGRIMGADNDSGLSFPNYQKIAQAHKLKYFFIKSNEDLNKKLKNIIAQKKGFICELFMDPNEEQIPKAINRRNDIGKSIPTDFDDMYPFLSREELNKNRNIKLYD